jgi:hypothetical protein
MEHPEASFELWRVERQLFHEDTAYCIDGGFPNTAPAYAEYGGEPATSSQDVCTTCQEKRVNARRTVVTQECFKYKTASTLLPK